MYEVLPSIANWRIFPTIQDFTSILLRFFIRYESITGTTLSKGSTLGSELFTNNPHPTTLATTETMGEAVSSTAAD